MSNELIIELTDGAVKNGYIRIPSDQNLFDTKYLAEDENDNSASSFTLEADDGEVFSTFILKNRGRLRQRFNAYFKSRSILPGTTVRILRIGEGKYSLNFSNEQQSLKTLFEQYKKNPYEKWMGTYKARCEQVSQLRDEAPSTIEPEILSGIWLEKSNGIASVGQGYLYKREFNAILPVLSDRTMAIINDPSPAMLDETLEWAEEQKKAGNLDRIIRAVIFRVFAAANPQQYSTVVNAYDQNRLIDVLNTKFGLSIDTEGNWAEKSASLMDAIKSQGLENEDLFTLNTFAWYLYEELVAGQNKDKESQQVSTKNKQEETDSLNRILYGPPGTGKTYHVVDEAIKIIDPEFYDEHDDGTEDSREALLKKYKELKELGQIEFVTFHQTFGYEEFIEGLRADVVNGQVNYHVEPGIFREICEAAQETHTLDSLDEAIDELKLLCSEQSVDMKTSSGKKFTVSYRDGRTFRIKPASSDKEGDYPASIENIRKMYKGAPRKEVYNPSYVQGILEYFEKHNNLEPYVEDTAGQKSKYVLIIDEINRGNISKIFGELITLIEPSKRQGEKEELQAVLPYSGDPITVPNNLYIVGTMNTADRSLALMDTALRRRFEFIEKMPNPEALEVVSIDGVEIDLPAMLTTLNKRIEMLYDREHMLGHAYFIDLVENATKTNIARVFKNKVIPLLQEYFFEDWEKIRLVLGDNQKKHESQQFILKQSVDMKEWFGSNDLAIEAPVNFMINDEAFYNMDSYLNIYVNS